MAITSLMIGTPDEMDGITKAIADLTDRLELARITHRIAREKAQLMSDKPNKPRNLLRLAGVINSANSEADNEAGELIERVRRNKARTLGLIAKGHHNEALREQMLSEAEKEQALADLEAAIGDNGGPLLEETDEAEEALRAELKAAKLDSTSQSSEKPAEKPKQEPVVQNPVATQTLGASPQAAQGTIAGDARKFDRMG